MWEGISKAGTTLPHPKTRIIFLFLKLCTLIHNSQNITTPVSFKRLMDKENVVYDGSADKHSTHLFP